MTGKDVKKRVRMIMDQPIQPVTEIAQLEMSLHDIAVLQDRARYFYVNTANVRGMDPSDFNALCYVKAFSEYLHRKGIKLEIVK